jgi:hypothetical protein
MSKENKVEVQKGMIDPNPMTMKQKTHHQKINDATAEMALRRHGQTLDLHIPKTGRK